MKLLTGSRVRISGGDTFFSAGAGFKYFPCAWLSLSAYFPYNWNQGRDKQTDREVSAHGLGDISLYGSFDLLELVNPSMVKVTCPATGGPIVALKDQEDVLKSPHLSIAAGVSFPVGSEDNKERWWVYPPQYQPGTGVWTGSAGIFYSQGIWDLTPGVGVMYVFAGSENSVGYDKPDSLVFTGSLNWLFWRERMGRLFTAVNVISPLGKGIQDGQTLEGSDTRLVLLDIGASLWVASFWGGSRKIQAGLLVTLPLVEGRTETEPRNGTGVSLFCTLGF